MRVEIRSDVDICSARQDARNLARQAGMWVGDETLVAAAVSELARNILLYAREGEIILEHLVDGPRAAIVVVALDEGPGIPDIAKAMEDGHSTSGGLGVGLPGVRRLMDEFQIDSAPGKGTTVTVTKWRR